MGAPPRFKPGVFVKFSYRDIGLGPQPIRAKQILVLHPNWQGKVHGIDLLRLTPAEAEVLREIMDPANRGKPHRIPLVADILRRMNPVEDIKNPVSFYTKFVKVFLRNKDAYRTYYARKMSGVVVIRQTSVKGGVINPKPLFKKIDSKPAQQTPSKPTGATPAKPTGKPPAAKKASSARPSKPSKPAPVSKPAAPAKAPNRLDLIRQLAAKKKT